MKNHWKNKWQSIVAVYTDRIFSNGLKVSVQQALPFWVASLFTGLIAVGYTKLFSLAEYSLHHLLRSHYWLIFLMAPICFVAAWAVVQYFAPGARGSGIPQVMAAIDLATPKHEHAIKKLLSLRIILTKIASSLLMVLGGGAIGREGPTIQIAGSVFRLVNQWIPATWAKLSRQSFILTGAAAGLAAAFNTPLGGVVFAMEELARIHIRFFRTALFSAVIIAGLTAQGLLGPYLYLGYPNVQGLAFPIFLGVIVTAIATGFLGSLMGAGILRIMKWKSRFPKGRMIFFVIGAGLVVAGLAYWLNPDVLGSGKDLMNQTLFTTDKEVSPSTVLLRIIGPIIAFNTGAAGGVFAPSLAAGASVGALVASTFQATEASANILILSGMVGFLTGITRTPFTSAILVLEMTDRHSVIFHLLVAALISNLAALLVDKHSFYEKLKKGYVEEVLQEETKGAS
ncbi:MAG TPA: chloride channel protein [Flavisolibacter sp.]|jgi:H+/Cl- antiporter ClcA|nr:chloride channel protein [Flavisolibacter sp.]